MEPQDPNREDGLSRVERRLAGWRPDSAGLDADAMLFAAGLAAGGRGRRRVLWPALCGVMTALAIGLGIWGLNEYDQRRLLSQRFSSEQPTPSTAPANANVGSDPSSAMPEGYFSMLRRLEIEKDPDAWLVSSPAGGQSIGPPPPEPAILKAGQAGNLLEQ
jgi:hypothetical protein